MPDIQPRRFIPPKAARGLTGISEREMRRRDDFPKPVKLGVGASGRIVYVEDEVIAWQADMVAKRDRELEAATDQIGQLPKTVGEDGKAAPPPEMIGPLEAKPPIKRRGRPPGSRNRPTKGTTAPPEARPLAAAPPK